MFDEIKIMERAASSSLAPETKMSNNSTIEGDIINNSSTINEDKAQYDEIKQLL